MLRFSQKGFAHVVLMVVLVGGLMAGLYLVQNVTKFFPRASTLSGPINPPPGPISQPTSPTPNPVADSDNDGWIDVIEDFAGTDKLVNCPTSTSDNAWPPDFNNNRFVNGEDYSILVRAIQQGKGRSAVQYVKRYDLNADGKLDNSDLDLHRSYFGQRCSVNPISTPQASFTSRPTPTPRTKPQR